MSGQYSGTCPTFAEAVVAAAHELVDARRPIPRRADVPLHVAVVGEQIAERVEGDVVVIAKPGGDHLEAFAVRRDLADEACGSVSENVAPRAMRGNT